MKKIFAMFLTLCLLFSMTGCIIIVEENEPIADESFEVPNKIVINESEPEIIEPTEVIINENTPVPTIEPTPEVENTFADLVVYDENNIRIICKGYDANDDEWSFGPELKFLIENNSDVDITVTAYDCSINGFMMDPLFYVDTAAGKKANDEMTWFDSDFEDNDITEIETIEFYFHIYNSDTYNDIDNSEIITLNFN